MIPLLALGWQGGQSDRAANASRYQQAIDLMETRGDCARAIVLFEEVAIGNDRSLAARSLLNIGRCAEKTRQGDPQLPYRRIIADFGDQSATVARARERLAALGVGGVADNGPSVLAKIAVGAEPDRMAISPDGQQLYVANRGADTITVIATGPRRVIRTLKVGDRPSAIVVSRDGAYLYVGLWGGGLRIVNTATWAVRAIGEAGRIFDMALLPTRGKLYFTLLESGLHSMDIRTEAITAISAGEIAVGLAADADERHIYVTYQGGKRRGHDPVRRFDTVTDSVVAIAEGAPNVGGEIAVAPDGSSVWTSGDDACLNANYDHVGCRYVPGGIVSVFDSSLQQATTLGFDGMVKSPAFSPDGSLVALNYDERRLLLIDSASHVTTSLPIPASGRTVFSADGSKAWVPLSRLNAVGLIEMILQVPTKAIWRGPGKLRLSIHSTPRLSAYAIEPNSLRITGFPPLKRDQLAFAPGGALTIDLDLNWVPTKADLSGQRAVTLKLDGKTAGGLRVTGTVSPVSP